MIVKAFFVGFLLTSTYLHHTHTLHSHLTHTPLSLSLSLSHTHTHTHTHSVYIGGECLEWIENNNMTPSKCVDETTPITLPQDMKHTGLIEMYQINQVLHLVQGRGIGLSNKIGEIIFYFVRRK